MDMTHPSSVQTQAEEPIKINHPEEEEHHESGASKMFKRVKARAKKFKNSLTKHDNEQDHDVDEDDDDEIDEPEKHVTPVHESSAMRAGVPDKPERLRHPRETNVPEPEEIVPPKTNVSPVVSSEPVEPATLRDATYGHEALAHSVRTTGKSDREEETRNAPAHPVRMPDLPEKEEESRDTHVPLLSATEDVTSTFAPGQREVNDLSVESDDQSKGTHHTRRGGEEAGVAGFAESLERMKLTDDVESESRIEKDSPTRFGGGESGAEVGKDIPARNVYVDQKIDSGIYKDSSTDFGGGAELREDFPVKKNDEFDQKIESGIYKDSSTEFGGKSELKEDFPVKKSNEFDQKYESGIGKDSSAGFGSESETGIREDFPAKSHNEFDQKFESGIGKDSPTGYGGESELREDFPVKKSNEFDQKYESGIGKDMLAGFGSVSETGTREDFPAKSHNEFDQKIESAIGKDSPTGFGSVSETGTREDFPAKSHEFEQTAGYGIGKNTGGGKPGTERREDFLGKKYEFEEELESAVGKDSPTGFAGESETGVGEGLGLKKDYGIEKDSAKGRHGYGEESGGGQEKYSKVETGLGRDLPTGTNDQFSPEFSGPKETDQFDSQAEQTRAEPKPSTYTEMIGSATTFVTEKAAATKNAAASSLGYSGETAAGKHESPVGEKMTPEDENVKGTGSPLTTTKLPLSGGGNGAEETKQGVSTRDNLAERLTHEEEDKAFSEMVSEKLNLGRGEEEKKKTATTKEVEVKEEKKLSDEVSEEKEHGEAVDGGGGMVGKIKGAYNYWLGGSTEEVKPKSPVSVEESSQSLGSTVGTKGFPDSGVTGLGETGSGTGAVPAQKGL
ncbi:low-temperature-induced 65 kDa protein [Eutrema salsugineum]|nr:low-temperature-induced 65 kDa protein [Eutrema salsugineum]